MHKINKYIFSILLFFSFLLPVISTPVLAVDDTTAGDTTAGDKTAGDNSGSTVNLTNPIGSDSIPALIGRVITAVLGVVGSLALLMVIYGGFTWMLAAGNSEKIKKGRDIIVWAMLGLVVIFTSYALVRFVITSI